MRAAPFLVLTLLLVALAPSSARAEDYLLARSTTHKLTVFADGGGAWCQSRIGLRMVLSSDSPDAESPTAQRDMMNRLKGPLATDCPAANDATLTLVVGDQQRGTYNAHKADGWQFIPTSTSPSAPVAAPPSSAPPVGAQQPTAATSQAPSPAPPPSSPPTPTAAAPTAATPASVSPASPAGSAPPSPPPPACDPNNLAAGKPLTADRIAGQWSDSYSGKTIEIALKDKNDLQHFTLAGRHPWTGTLAGGKLTFERTPTAAEMDQQAPEWARQAVEGQVKWSLELVPREICGAPSLDGNWYPGRIKITEDAGDGGTQQSRTATVVGKGDPIPMRYGQEMCCGMADNTIFFPHVTDPMIPPQELEAPRDPAVGGAQVFLHDGGFFLNAADVTLPSFFYDMRWTRHYRSDATFRKGGLMGHGWDFFFNKRIVATGLVAKDGLLGETVGKDTPKLTYYSGTGRAEVYTGTHSENRKLYNFDANFDAYVSTYKSPDGEFHEIERYVLTDHTQPHPFAKHPNVDGTERLFYVLREKDGTRYVFNCRGQLIYVLSRNDSTAQTIRVELDYNGQINPLTQNPMLSAVIDAAGRQFTITTVAIGEDSLNTNLHGKPRTDNVPIPYIKTISVLGTTVTYGYRGGDSEPVLESVTISAPDAQPRRWVYGYSGEKLLATVTTPNESAKGDGGRPYLRNDYRGNQIASQTLNDQLFIFTWGDKVTVATAINNRTVYALEKIGDFHVIAEATVMDADPTHHGGPWTTRYAHNQATQITEITYPAGNGVTFDYQGANAPVTLGPIRDWVDNGYTYESDLGLGNLLAVTRHAAVAGATGTTGTTSRSAGTTYSGPTTSVTKRAYERLYNQLSEATDALNNVTRLTYGDYQTAKNRGNPTSIENPPVLQPDGTQRTVPTNSITYNVFGQHETSQQGADRTTTTSFDPATHYVQRVDLPGGGFEQFSYDAFGNVTVRKTPDGTVAFERDGFGQLKKKTVDPTGLKLVTTYGYDQDGNTIEVDVEVKDTFDGAPAGLTAAPSTWQKTSTTYDLLDRPESETFAAGGLSSQTTFTYSSSGDLDHRIEPSRDGNTPFKTVFSYDARHLLLESIEAAGTEVARSVRRSYDANGNLAGIETGSGDALARQSLHYDGLGRIDNSVDILGAQNSFIYDAAANVLDLSIKGAAGVLHHTSYAYDGYGNVIRRSVDSFTGAPEVSQWFYSADLTLAKTISPNGAVTNYDHDPQGRLIHLTDPLGNETKNSYDAAGNLVSVETIATERTLDAGTGGFKESRKTTTITTAYDSAGRVLKVTRPGGEERRFLDSLGRVRGSVSTTGQLTRMTYDGLGRMTELANELASTHKSYTDGGLVKESDGPDGHLRFTYDALGRPSTRADMAANATTRFHYGPGMEEVTQPNGTVVQTRFNARGLPVAVAATPNATTFDNPDVKNFRIVYGATGENFDYDELGRLTHAWTGGANKDSEDWRKFDGLDRLTEERQSWSGLGQTVDYLYADDFSSMEIVYPELSKRVHYRLHSDPVGRIDRLSLDAKEIANYLYSGLDRLALRWQDNGIETRYAYDDGLRLNQIQVARIGNDQGPTGHTLWSALAQFDAYGATMVTEVTAAHGKDPDTILRTQVSRDPLGRVLAATTSLLQPVLAKAPSGAAGALAMVGGAKPQAGVSSYAGELSGTFHRYDGMNLAATADYGGLAVPPLPDDSVEGLAKRALGCAMRPVACLSSGVPVRSLRVDRFDYDASHRVADTLTSGGLNGKVTASLDSIEAVDQASASASRPPNSRQDFSYDGNGNLIADGRYLYAYDFRNRLTHIVDRWTPYRYHEEVYFLYDALGRRIGIRPDRDESEVRQGLLSFDQSWVGATTWFVYDGDRVIEEVWRDHPKQPAATLLARYFYGARPGELLRIDRRPEDDPHQDLKTFYVHHDLNGTLHHVSDTGGELHAVENDMPQGAGKTSTEAAAGDRNMIVGSGDRPGGGDTDDKKPSDEKNAVREPYLGDATRVDGFAGVTYRDDARQTVVNYRSAPAFIKATERAVLDEARSEVQERLQVVVGTVVALPIAWSVGLSAATAEVTQAGLLWSGLLGGFSSVGFGYAKSFAFDSEYSLSDAGTDFLIGAAYGINGKVVGGLGLKGVANAAAHTVANTAMGVGIGAAGGARLGDPDTFLGNALMSVLMTGGSEGVGWAGGKFKSIWYGVAADAAEALPAGPAAVHEEIATNGASGAGDEYFRAGPMGAFELQPGIASTNELKALPGRILARMERSTLPQVREAARRIRTGVYQVVFYGKNQSVANKAKDIAKSLRAYGYHNADLAPGTIWINVDKIPRTSRGALNDLFVASTVVHESIHAMGGGEICAFLGQTQFVLDFPREFGELPGRVQTMASVFVGNSIIDFAHFIGDSTGWNYAKQTGDPELQNLNRPIDPWIVQAGGFARALRIAHPGFRDTIGRAIPGERPAGAP
jgi:YD repeat-containing protein